MHVFFAAALAAGLSTAAIVGPVRDVSLQQRFFLGSQGVAEKAPDAAQAEVPEITASIPDTEGFDVTMRADGTPLSCDEIRAMDEVELITDESYCR